MAAGLNGAAGALVGGVDAPAELSFAGLSGQYRDFALPQAVVELAGTPFSSKGEDMVLGDLHVELTSGFEASLARFRIYGVYHSAQGRFRYAEVKRQVVLGASLAVRLGYADKLCLVFVGFVASVAFGFEEGGVPYIEVTGMDVKGLMMAGTYSFQLLADNCADAVRELLGRAGYERLKNTGAVLGVEVSDTPDLDPALRSALEAAETARAASAAAKQAASAAQRAAQAGDAAALARARTLAGQAEAALSAVETAQAAFQAAKQAFARTKAAVKEAVSAAAVPASPVPVPVPPGPVSARTLELVAESDYEFVVKAAKRFNFEFFVDRGTVLFRRAKANRTPLMELGPGAGLGSFRVEYSITGLVGAVEARAMDPGEGRLVSSEAKLEHRVSTGGAAKGLVSQGKKVYIDPAISTQAEADARAASLLERMSYRLGELEGECIGLPELAPGRFLRLAGLGAPADNEFYVTAVVHDFRDDTGYRTRLTARTDHVKGEGPL